MMALVQVAFAVLVFGFFTAVLFCVLLGEVLHLRNCDLLMDFVFRTIHSIRAFFGR